jgi:hypothetical protein
MTTRQVELTLKIRSEDWSWAGANKRMRRREITMALKSSILLLVSAVLISGCVHYPVNAPLAAAIWRPSIMTTFFSTARLSLT